MSVKINLRIIMKNLAADPEIGFLTKSILKPYDREAAITTACELNTTNDLLQCRIYKFRITYLLFYFYI